MFNNFGGGFGQNPNYGFSAGMVPNQQQQAPVVQSWLTPEKMALLKKGVSKFNLSVSDEDLARGQCNHMNNGKSMLIPDGDGSNGFTCQICGTHFTVRDLSNEEVKNATDNILDILNIIKISYLSLDPNTALEYFQIIPLIEKIPRLYEISQADINKYNGGANFVQGSNQDPFRIFSSLVTPGFTGGFQQPQYGGFNNFNQYGYANAAPVAPQYAGQAQFAPQANPMYGQYGQPQGFQPQAQNMYQQPAPAANPYQPQQPQYGYQPQQPAQAQAPAAPQQTPVVQQPAQPTQATTTVEPEKK